MAETVMTPAQAAEYLHTSIDALQRWRSAGTGPRFTRIGNGHGRVRYLLSELDSFLGSRTVDTEDSE